MASASSREVRVLAWEDRHRQSELHDEVATEIPLALSYNKRSHTVMMVTPSTLSDFAAGFSLTEGIIDQPSDLLDMVVIERELGLELAITVNEACAARLDTQRRNLVGRTGCGLCGAESLQQAMRGPAAVGSRVSLDHNAIQNAIASLNTQQPLQSATGALHGAAWCDTDGNILVVREDVGRHNALDKVIGHLFRSGFDAGKGFILVSSRASYEMVYKAAAAGVEVLVAVSAPTSLAIDYALRSGLTLVGFARPGRHNIYTFEGRVKEAT